MMEMEQGDKDQVQRQDHCLFNSPLLSFFSRRDAHGNWGGAACRTHAETRICVAQAANVAALQVLHSVSLREKLQWGEWFMGGFLLCSVDLT